MQIFLLTLLYAGFSRYCNLYFKKDFNKNVQKFIKISLNFMRNNQNACSLVDEG